MAVGVTVVSVMVVNGDGTDTVSVRRSVAIVDGW